MGCQSTKKEGKGGIRGVWDFDEFEAVMSILHVCIYQGSEQSGNSLAAAGGRDKLVGGRR